MKKETMKKDRQKIAEKAVQNIFQQYDEDKNDYIDLFEFKKIVRDLKLEPLVKITDN